MKRSLNHVTGGLAAVVLLAAASSSHAVVPTLRFEGHRTDYVVSTTGSENYIGMTYDFSTNGYVLGIVQATPSYYSYDVTPPGHVGGLFIYDFDFADFVQVDVSSVVALHQSQ